MIDFTRTCLDNGLKVLLHRDTSTPLVAINLLYNIGSRDENPELTGFAHLFEHLMFGGTPEVPDYDTPLMLAGGDNNAFTSNDITNYFITLPADNIETGLWLESNRMQGLDFSQKSLDNQKNVVIEEFKQRYLNQPYGDSLLKLKPLAYKVHPYRWSTIGMSINHIEKATLDQVKDFYYSHYAPNNAILSITGNIDPQKVLLLVKKWFDPIEPRKIAIRSLTEEPVQKQARQLTIENSVPADALYKAWHVGPRKSNDFYSLDMLTDILAGGESGRLYNSLVREKKQFTEINAYVTGDIDPGLLIINGKLMKGIDFKSAEASLNEEIEKLKTHLIPPDELDKVKNKFESSHVFSNTNILNKAMNLSFFELLGNASTINDEVTNFFNVTSEAEMEISRRILIPDNCSTLYYKSGKPDNR
jgi:zinc protease